MNVTSLDLILLGAVPSVVAVIGAVLWRLAVHRIVRNAGASVAPDRRPAPAASVGVLVHAGGESGAVSPQSRH